MKAKSFFPAQARSFFFGFTFIVKYNGRHSKVNKGLIYNLAIYGKALTLTTTWMDLEHMMLSEKPDTGGHCLSL